MQEAYTTNIKKVGVGVGVFTFLSLASVSSSALSSSMTSSITSDFMYEAADIINDSNGDVCISTNLSNQVVGDIISDKDEFEDLSVCYESKSIKMHITEVKKHVSKFDFEEEYEEI